MKTAIAQQVFATNLRTRLKELMAKEIENLPVYLESLPTKEKLDYLLKLMPYVFPKIDSVHFTRDEPGSDWQFEMS